MKLEKHRYDDIVILKFTGELETFNLPTFSDRMDRMVEAMDPALEYEARHEDFTVEFPPVGRADGP